MSSGGERALSGEAQSSPGSDPDHSSWFACMYRSSGQPKAWNARRDSDTIGLLLSKREFTALTACGQTVRPRCWRAIKLA